MATFIHILQIIGIIILVLLAIVIALLLIVLFDPIRYRFLLNYDAYKDDNNNYCFIKLRWLLNIVSCRIDIGLKGIDYDFRLFGFKSKLLDKYLFDKSDDDIDKNDDLFDNDDEMSGNNASINNLNENEDSVNEVKNNKEIVENYTEENPELDIKEGQEDSTELLDEIEEIWEDLVSEDENDQDEFESISGKKSFNKLFKDLKHIDFKRLTLKKFFREFIKTIGKIIESIKGVIKAIIKSVKKLYEKYELISIMWNKKSTQVAIIRIKNYVSKLCKSILPKKKSIDIDIGFEDPAQTGMVLAIIGSLYGVIGDTLKVNPNFEDKECKIKCKFIGNMTLLNLGIIFIKFMRDKAIKRLISNIDKLKEDLSNE